MKEQPRVTAHSASLLVAKLTIRNVGEMQEKGSHFKKDQWSHRRLGLANEQRKQLIQDVNKNVGKKNRCLEANIF